MDKLSAEDIKSILITVRDLMLENEQYLFKLDSEMGDGDLGITMKKGFNHIADTLKGLQEEDIGQLLLKAAMAITSTSPGTMGTLMGTGLMRAGKSAMGKNQADLPVLADMMDSFVQGIMDRGKSKPGDRTIIDSLYPAAQSLKQSAQKREGLKQAFFEAYQKSKEGLESTKNMSPSHGKAMYHKQMAAEIEDPGAAAGMLWIKGFYDYISQGS